MRDETQHSIDPMDFVLKNLHFLTINLNFKIEKEKCVSREVNWSINFITQNSITTNYDAEEFKKLHQLKNFNDFISSESIEKLSKFLSSIYFFFAIWIISHHYSRARVCVWSLSHFLCTFYYLDIFLIKNKMA